MSETRAGRIPSRSLADISGDVQRWQGESKYFDMGVYLEPIKPGDLDELYDALVANPVCPYCELGYAQCQCDNTYE